MAQIAVSYLLAFCTSHGLRSIGEPPLTSYFEPKAHPDPPGGLLAEEVTKTGIPKRMMPVWLIFVFFALVTLRYALSFLIWYAYQVAATVVMVATTSVSTVAAANAHKHSDAPEPINNLSTMAREATNKPENGHIGRDFRPKKLVSQKTWAKIHKNSPWARICGLSCFRGINAYLIMCIPQWYIAEILDFFLSGQPSDMKLGYGCSSVAVAVVFGGTTAIWTHYAITEPSNKNVLDHFPKGHQIWAELAQITLAWAVSEQVTMSLPLALSRSFGLRQYAFDPTLWSTLDKRGLYLVVLQFGLVFLLYLALVAFVSIPANITLRRIHASMLPPEDVAIVPFHRANPEPSKSENPSSDKQLSAVPRRSKLSVSEAWATITWSAYFRVMNVYVQYFFINQILQILYWTANWKLHEIFEAGNYVSPNLPSSPSPMALPILKKDLFA